jgi:hypothetical protein
MTERVIETGRTYITRTGEAQRAADLARERRDRTRAYDEAKNPDMARHRVRRRDGLDLLLDGRHITEGQHSACRRFQAAYEIRAGRSGGRDSLDTTPRGDVDGAQQAICDAGKLVKHWQDHASTALERELLDKVIGEGCTVSSLAGSGRRLRKWTDMLSGLICRIVPA